MTAAAGGYRPQGLLRLFIVPGAVIAANAAALAGVLALVGLVPALAGAGMVLDRFAAHGDEAFRAAVRHQRATWRRDLPVTCGTWMLLAAVGGNVLVLPRLPGDLRVLAVGAMLPALWALISWISAYITVAADARLDRTALVLATTHRMITHPVRALAAPAIVLAVSPLWLLAPFTLACGLAVPPYLLHALWRPAAAMTSP